MVIIAAGMTLALTISLTIFAFFTKSDFTTKGSALFCAAFSLIIFGIFSALFYKYCPILRIFYCLFGIILFGLYLIYDI